MTWHHGGMQRLSSSLALVVALIVPSLAGCDVRFQGELGGDGVPSFGSAAFAVQEGPGGRAKVTGFAVDGDSCAEAIEMTRLQKRSLEATTENRRDETARAQADWFNRVIPEGEWLVTVVLNATGQNLLSETTVDIDNPDTDVNVQLSLCRSDGDAEARDGFFQPNLDCFTASNGDLDIDLNDDSKTLRLIADSDPVGFRGNSGDAGDLLLDATFSPCDGLEQALDELDAVSGGGVIIGEGEGEGEGCFEECVEQPNGEVICSVKCP